MLYRYRIYYCILDGAEVNRQFIKLHFQDELDAVDEKFVAHNIYTGKPMVFLIDPKVGFCSVVHFFKMGWLINMQN